MIRHSASHPGNDKSVTCHATGIANRDSTTTCSTQTPSSQTRSTTGLKIIQEQVGHDHASTTAIYTCVSSDFRTRSLRRVLDATIEAALRPGRTS